MNPQHEIAVETEIESSEDGSVGRVRRLLGSTFGPFLALVVVIAVFSAADVIRSHRLDRRATFPRARTAQLILRDSSKVGIAALGMTLIIIAGGIDLSAGAAIALCATVIAWFFKYDYSPATAIAAGIITGCAIGMINGTLISLLRVVPFIVTLGTMTIFLGLGLILGDDKPIRAFGLVPKEILALRVPYPEPGSQWMLVSSGVWLMFALALITGCVLKYSVFGRHVFALGSNEATARLCGIHVTRLRIIVYAVAGFFIGVAGLLQFTMLGGEGDPQGGIGIELQVIAAVVIGGGSLNGGRGSVVGTLSGALIMGTIETGSVILNIPTSYQKVIMGVIIIAAVTLDQIRQRRMTGSA